MIRKMNTNLGGEFIASETSLEVFPDVGDMVEEGADHNADGKVSNIAVRTQGVLLTLIPLSLHVCPLV